MIYKPPLRYAYRKALPDYLRDSHGLNALHRVQLNTIGRYMYCINSVSHSSCCTPHLRTKLRTYRRKLLQLLLKVLKSCNTVTNRHRKGERKSISDFEKEGINFYEEFRFQSGDQLRQLLQCFNFPEGVIIIQTHKFTAEEVLLISLRRLSFPSRWCDVKKCFPNRHASELSSAFNWFLEFMIVNWGYLILNNREYWLDSLAVSAEAIRQKLAALPREANRLMFPAANSENGFNIALFIDNTIMAMSRPGGGPSESGENAQRISKLLQQAFWTGWKKLHGLKWQSTTMANGMDFEVWGPASVRRNDNFSLHRSNIENKLSQLQEGRELKYKIHGDSAYSISDWIVSGGGKGMAAVRESIEWTYKDLKNMWAFCHYKNCLKLVKQPIAKIFFVCMLLRNAHVTLNGCQTSAYFNMLPPTLQDWTKNGAQYNPIPLDIFN